MMMKGRPGGPVEEVVVAGGCTGDPTAVVEIFNLKLESWRTGKSRGAQPAAQDGNCPLVPRKSLLHYVQCTGPV